MGKYEPERHDQFGSASDWLGKWCRFSKSVTERGKRKPMHFCITIDTQLKIDLEGTLTEYQIVKHRQDIIPLITITATKPQGVSNLFFILW